MTELEQRLTGENQVLRDLLKDSICIVDKEALYATEQQDREAAQRLSRQIASAPKPAPHFYGLES